MDRIITVSGSGSISVSPDRTEVRFTLSAVDKNYSAASGKIAEQTDELRAALVSAGLAEDDIRTVNFSVNSNYDNVRDESGSYRSVFSGFRFAHTIRAEFGLDAQLLTAVLAAAAESAADPELSVAFTVSDTGSVRAKLLKIAAENARTKAEILCSASGVTLGELVSIGCGGDSYELQSPTRYNVGVDCLRTIGAVPAAAVNIAPDDIKVEDSVDFIWEIR